MKSISKGHYRDANGNQVISSSSIKNIKFKFYGKNNTLYIDNTKIDSKVNVIFRQDNSSCFIGESGFEASIYLGEASVVIIGDEVTTTGHLLIKCTEEKQVAIGDDCMFATQNQIRTDDSHPIFDVETKQRVNKALDVNIGAKVWIGYNAVIFGGANISSGSIIGFNSFVRNKSFPNNCIIAGTPAKIIKKDVFWTRSSMSRDSPEVIKNSAYEAEDSFALKTNNHQTINFGKGFERVLNYYNKINNS